MSRHASKYLAGPIWIRRLEPTTFRPLVSSTSLLAARPLPKAHTPCPHFRGMASMPQPPSPKRGPRVAYLFGGLVSVGLLLTIYGLLEYYYSLQTWPEPIRTPLKAALKAKQRGDYDRSEAYFRKALEAALSVPPSTLDPDPLLKLSGIYISLSAMLESIGQPITAFESLRSALEHFGREPLSSDPSKRLVEAGIGTGSGSGWYTGHLSQEDHLRAIGLHQKLGQLALQMSSMSVPPPFPLTSERGTAPQRWDDAAEYYLSAALTAMLRLGLTRPEAGGPAIVGRDSDLPDPIVLSEGGEGEVDAGGRVDKRGLGMTMESLAEVYARKGQYDIAGQLLLQAVSTLLPPQSKEVPPLRDRCQAAMLMTTISSHALQPRTPQAIKTAKSWSLRSLQISEQALKEGEGAKDIAMTVCGRARCVGLHNMGMLAELEGDRETALKHFTNALATARDIGFTEAKREATDAIRRVRSSL